MSAEIEKELAALAKIAEAMESLDGDQQRRCIDWVTSRYSLQLISAFTEKQKESQAEIKALRKELVAAKNLNV